VTKQQATKMAQNLGFAEKNVDIVNFRNIYFIFKNLN
jgi:hypothetical protein